MRDFSVTAVRTGEIIDAAVSNSHAQVVNDTRGHDDLDAFTRIVYEVASSKPALEVVEGFVENLSGAMQTIIEHPFRYSERLFIRHHHPWF